LGRLKVNAKLPLDGSIVDWFLEIKNDSMRILKDSEIKELIGEEKVIPDGLCWPMNMSERNNHKHKGFEVNCDSGNRFVIKARQSCVNPLDFSVILGYMLPGSYTVFRLRRYNGKSHPDTNVLEAASALTKNDPPVLV